MGDGDSKNLHVNYYPTKKEIEKFIKNKIFRELLN